MLFGIEPLFSPFPSKDTRITIFRSIVFPRVLSGCENWSPTLQEVQRLRLSENRFFFSGLDSSNWQRRPFDVPRSHYLTTHSTHYRQRCPRRCSNPQSQEASGRRPRLRTGGVTAIGDNWIKLREIFQPRWNKASGGERK